VTEIVSWKLEPHEELAFSTVVETAGIAARSDRDLRRRQRGAGCR
jgi:hypothetical protein